MIIDIVGAGLAGLLAANMLRNHQTVIWERQEALPNNHSAVLRFRSSVVGDTLGIAFRPVTMIKTTLPWRNAVADALLYSFKNTGTLRSDRSINAGEQVAERFIAPPDLIARMAERQNVIYNTGYDFEQQDRPVISTIPMPVLMRVLKYPHTDQTEFLSLPGVNVRATIADCDAYISLAVPDPSYPFSRISITGNELIVEIPNSVLSPIQGKDIAASAVELLGISQGWLSNVTVHQQKYAKITPIPDEARREFIYWASHEHSVYSLGRYATWRPKLLLDDLVKDIKIIEQWIARQDKYGMMRGR
jgi:hypothetical protein